MDLHADFRAHKDAFAVHVRAEGDAFLIDFPKLGQGKHLEPAAVCEDGFLPSHKFVEAAQTLDEFVAGADMEMIGIAEFHLAF